MGLLDANGRPIDTSPGLSGRLQLDAALKTFEGPVNFKLWNDRLTADGLCLHCQSKVHHELRLTRRQAAAATRDEQFHRNLQDLLADKVKTDHQCGLIYEGRDTIEDLYRRLGAA